MKWLLFFISLSGAWLVEAQPADVRPVYMIPMQHGFDQFLANQLTSQHVLQVVTDPKRAQIVFTDRIGEPLEERLKEWTRPPEPPPAAAPVESKDATKKEPAETKDTSKTKDSVTTKDTDTAKPSRARTTAGDVPVHVDPVGNMSAFSRGKGTIFLVDMRTRQVLWSTFERPRDFTPHSLDRSAQRIVTQLKKDLAK